MTEQQETATESENSQSRYTPHDRLFKEFFRRFLEEFMWLFYPAKSARLDFDKLRFIDKELVINFPGQAMRITDVVARLPVIAPDEPALRTSVDDNIIRRKKDDVVENESEKKEELIIVHIDAEANKPKPIPNRMHEYYSLLRIIKNEPVLPIALLIRGRSTKAGAKAEIDADNNRMQTYTERLWGRELLKFHYYEIVLQDLLSEEYLDLNDPVAASLAVLMKHPEEMSALIKKRSLDIITQSDEISDGDKYCLINMVQVYVPDEDVKGGTESIMQQLTKYRLTWWERAKVEGQQNILIKQLGVKFKEITDEIVERIRAIEDERILDDIATQVLFIQSLDDLALPEPA